MYHFYPCKTQLEFSFPPTVLQGFHCIPHKTYSFPSNIIITPCKYLQCGQRTSDVQHNSVWLVPWTRIWAKFNPYKTCKLGWGALLPSKRSPSLFLYFMTSSAYHSAESCYYSMHSIHY